MAWRISIATILAALLSALPLVHSAPVPEEKKSKVADFDEATAVGGDADAQARQKAESINNLKQIALACHSYHDVNGKMPDDVKDKEGKLLLSWRMLLLPYLEENPLYQQFRLQEPWDSATNIKLMEKIPKIFESTR